ncbi:molybdopterin cofactor-binding domain-containing protein [Polynucleobacter necessarius]|uniref:molybdopterin cofactor-binding domain-containing protein n=1 Tax=Polynucleobacter necessarius TaxID=576610 RepID=UPI001E621397|nr:molybdopterin cofactor-binding domain-containing protein [Polynucleobacter necessarius]
MGYASYSACVAEVTVQNNVVKVTRLVFALNSGHVVNPYLTREQIEGSIAMALGAISCLRSPWKMAALSSRI